MGKQRKGGAYERELCKRLSLWWTNDKRTDVFWRTAGSGARATVRSKYKQDTFGSYGDITAIDPIGQPLIDCLTIEIKRGYSKCTITDLIDTKQNRPKLAEWFDKTIRTWKKSGSWSWLLIHKRDHKTSMVYMPVVHLYYLIDVGLCLCDRLEVVTDHYKLGGVRLDDFLSVVSVDRVIKASQEC